MKVERLVERLRK